MMRWWLGFLKGFFRKKHDRYYVTRHSHRIAAAVRDLIWLRVRRRQAEPALRAAVRVFVAAVCHRRRVVGFGRMGDAFTVATHADRVVAYRCRRLAHERGFFGGYFLQSGHGRVAGGGGLDYRAAADRGRAERRTDAGRAREGASVGGSGVGTAGRVPGGEP